MGIASRLLPLLSCVLTSACVATEPVAWHQGAGPHGNWSASGPPPPLEFSLRTGKGVLWRVPLPETGQGGLTVVGERLFVTTMAPWEGSSGLSEEELSRYAHAIEKRGVVGKDIEAHAFDARTGERLWTRRLPGEVPSIYTYPFSDATSASPVADGERVWFTNAGGLVACFTHGGDLLWERRFTPTFDGPFNKQFEPFLVADPDRGPEAKVFVHMEPFEAPSADASPPGRWHHLVGLDAATGEELWRSVDALTHYNAPTLVAGPEGPCVLHARGGPHQVPERPVGVSLTRLTGPRAGEALWRYEDPRGNHEASLQTMAYDEEHVFWLLREPRSALVVLDRQTGRELREISLRENVTLTTFDPGVGEWSTATGVDLERGVFPARYSMIAAAGCVWFQCYATAWGKPSLDPPYSFARVDPTAENPVAYLEVPTDRVRGPGDVEEFLWRTPRVARPLNSRGEEVTGDDRSRWDGWDWVFNGSPTRVNGHLYFTLASGVVYVLDAEAEVFDQGAFLALNDLGPAGELWTANSISYADGRLYHRTGAELVCIGR